MKLKAGAASTMQGVIKGKLVRNVLVSHLIAEVEGVEIIQAGIRARGVRAGVFAADADTIDGWPLVNEVPTDTLCEVETQAIAQATR